MIVGRQGRCALIANENTNVFVRTEKNPPQIISRIEVAMKYFSLCVWITAARMAPGTLAFGAVYLVEYLVPGL
jgi:hypothetical protein